MGARQSKRSVDITTDPKKAAEGSTERGECELEGRVGKIEDSDSQNIVNGVEAEVKNEGTDETEEVVENGACNIGSGDVPVPEEPIKLVPEESADSKPTEANNEENTGTATIDSKKNKKDKVKKNRSFRNIFSKKDKSKPSKDLDKSVEEKDTLPEGSDDAVKEDETKPIEEKLEEKDVAQDLSENNAVETVNSENKETSECSPIEIEKVVEESTTIQENKTGIDSENVSSQCEVKISEKIEKTVPVVKSESESVKEIVSYSTKSDTVENSSNMVVTTETESIKKEFMECKTEITVVTKSEEVLTSDTIDKIEAANDNLNEIIQNEEATSFVEKEQIEIATLNTVTEVPPPLPASPPPSPLSALAQSTMAETVPTEILNGSSEENMPITPETNAQSTLITECNIPKVENERITHEAISSSEQSQVAETIVESTITSIKTTEIVENSQHFENIEENTLESQDESSTVKQALNIETNAVTIDEPVTLPPNTESINEMECASDDLPSPPIAESPEPNPLILVNEEPLIVTQLSEGDSCKKKLDVPILSEDINDEQTDLIKQDIMTAGEIVCSNGSN